MNDTNILLIDDDAKLLKSLARDLSELGYSVTTTVSAIEASAALGQDTFHAVVCDHHMHGESGVSFLASLRHKHPKMAKILLSGGLDAKKKEEAIIREIAHSVLDKPCEIAVLDAKIQEAIMVNIQLEESDSNPNIVSSTVKKIATYFVNSPN